MTIEDIGNLSRAIREIGKYTPLYSHSYSNDFDFNAGKKYGYIDDLNTEFEGTVYEYDSVDSSEDGNHIWTLSTLPTSNIKRSVKITDKTRLCETFKFDNVIRDLDNHGMDIIKIVALADHIKSFPEEYKTLKHLINNRGMVEKMIKKPNFKLEDHLDVIEFVSDSND